MKFTRTTRTNFIVRYPVAMFFILAMALGAGTMYLVVQGIIPAGAALAAALSGSISGIVMTLVKDGRPGLKVLLSRLLIWRVRIGDLGCLLDVKCRDQPEKPR